MKMLVVWFENKNITFCIDDSKIKINKYKKMFAKT